MQPDSPDRLLIGSEGVTIRRRGSSSHDVARMLGREVNDAVETIYLDRVIHRFEGESFADCDWQAYGAFVTELRRLSASAEQESR